MLVRSAMLTRYTCSVGEIDEVDEVNAVNKSDETRNVDENDEFGKNNKVVR